MKKNEMVYILYMFQIFFIGLFVLVLLAYNIKISEDNFLGNEMYTQNVSGVQLSDHRLAEKVDFGIPKVDKDIMLYKHITVELEEIVRGTYGTGDVFGLSEYLSYGRFFEAKDYETKTATAVVGSSILPTTIEKNGKNYYAYNQEMYEIIGVFQETKTDLDKVVYLNLANILEKEDHIGLYYVDAKNKTTVEKVVKTIKNDAEGKYSITDVTYESPVEYMLGSMGTTLLTFSVFAAVFCLLITSMFFVSRQKYSVAVKKLCGMTKRNLFTFYGKKLFLLFAISYCFIVLAMKALSVSFGNSIFAVKTLTIWHYLMTGTFLFLLGLATVYYIVGSAEKVNISDTLKGI